MRQARKVLLATLANKNTKKQTKDGRNLWLSPGEEELLGHALDVFFQCSEIEAAEEELLAWATREKLDVGGNLDEETVAWAAGKE